LLRLLTWRGTSLFLSLPQEIPRAFALSLSNPILRKLNTSHQAGTLTITQRPAYTFLNRAVADNLSKEELR